MYKIMPESYRRKIEEWLRLAGSKKSPQGFVNYSFSFSIALGFLISVFIGVNLLLLWIVSSISIFLLFHGLLVLAIDRRTTFVENVLPDALQLMAANSRAGYIPSKSLLLSAREEFGPLATAIKNVGKDLMTGKPLESALQKIKKEIKSDILGRTVDMIIEGIRSGGQFSSLLEENADDIRRMQLIKREMRASIVMYIIFISFAGCIGAPLLYALSGFLISTLSKLGARAKIPETVTSKLPLMKFGKIELSPEFLNQFSIAALLITTIFGGLIIGLISHGRERAGIKYVPILIIVALLIYYFSGVLIRQMFDAFLPIAWK